MNNLIKPPWPAIRMAYINQEGSLKALSQRFNVPLRTIERRSSREGWRSSVERAGGIAMAVAAETAKAEGEKIGMVASELVQRTVGLTEKLLTEIEQRLDRGQLTTGELRSLIAGWRDVVGVGRVAFRLDDPSAHQAARIGIYCAGGLTVKASQCAEPSKAVEVVEDGAP